MEQRIQDIRDKNQNTTVDRGTEYAWKQLELLADKKQNDFGAAFDKFMNCSSGFISEAYWRQFSVLMDLYGKSGGASEEHEPYIKKIRFSAATDEPKMYKDVQLFPKRGRTVLSFGYDSKDITSAINSGTANGTYLSSLMRPVLRNSNDMFAKGPVKSMSALSALWNNYNAWCKGEKEPYVSYKRDVILKLALASSVYNQADLHKVMSLAGSSNFNYLDRKEAMVYLVVRYREELHQQIKNMNDAISVVEDKGWGTPGAMKAFKRMKDVAKSLPPEYLAGRPDCLKEKSELPGTNDKAVVQDAIKWWRLTVNDKRVPSVIEYIRKSDLLRIRFGASSETADEIREKFFYGPYSGDFVKETGKNRSGVSEETSWVQMECEIFRLMEEVLSEEGVRFVFELWHEDVIWRTFAGISPSCWYQECDLVEMRLEEIEEAMIEALEDAGISTETMRGQCADVEACLERLHTVAAQTGFMKQNPNALETEYLLEQWFYVLAGMRVLGIPTGDSTERLKEYVFHWEIIGGVNNFKYANYRKERGFSSVEEMAKDKLSDKHWEHQQENYKLIRERWKKDFRFWERVYFDYMAICVSVDWMKVNHPESYSLYALMLRELRQKIKEDQVNDEIREKLFSKKGGNQPFSNMKSEWKLACSNAEYFLKLHKTGTEEYKALEKQVKVLKQRYEQFFDDVERAND